MYTLVPFRRAMTNGFPTLFNDHFMREFFNVDDMPEMRVDVREKDGSYLLEADLPGVSKENISLSVDEGVLTISADLNSEKKEEKNGYVCSERRCGHVERSFNLEGIDVSGIKNLVSEAPLQKVSDVPMPTLEKLLVDILRDSDFFYLQGSESEHIIENAFNLYAVNRSRLFRYAGRRKVKEELSSILNNLNIQ